MTFISVVGIVQSQGYGDIILPNYKNVLVVELRHPPYLWFSESLYWSQGLGMHYSSNQPTFSQSGCHSGIPILEGCSPNPNIQELYPVLFTLWQTIPFQGLSCPSLEMQLGGDTVTLCTAPERTWSFPPPEIMIPFYILNNLTLLRCFY